MVAILCQLGNVFARPDISFRGNPHNNNAAYTEGCVRITRISKLLLVEVGMLRDVVQPPSGASINVR